MHTDRQADAIIYEINEAHCMTLCELIEHLQAADTSRLVCIMTLGAVLPSAARRRDEISSFQSVLYWIHVLFTTGLNGSVQ